MGALGHKVESRLESISAISYLKERQVSKGIDRVQHAAVIVAGRVDLSALQDGDVEREPFVSPV